MKIGWETAKIAGGLHTYLNVLFQLPLAFIKTKPNSIICNFCRLSTDFQSVFFCLFVWKRLARQSFWCVEIYNSMLDSWEKCENVQKAHLVRQIRSPRSRNIVAKLYCHSFIERLVCKSLLQILEIFLPCCATSIWKWGTVLVEKYNFKRPYLQDHIETKIASKILLPRVWRFFMPNLVAIGQSQSDLQSLKGRNTRSGENGI